MAKDAWEYSQTYFDRTMKQVKLAMYQEQAEQLDAFCKEHGLKKQTFIKQCIREGMSKYGVDFLTDSEANELARVRKNNTPSE